MQNVEWQIKGDKLIIEIDLTKEFGPSKSGKTITIASTRGNQQVEGTDAIIGLNVYKYPESVQHPRFNQVKLSLDGDEFAIFEIKLYLT